MPLDQSPHTAANTARLFGSLAVMSVGVAATLATLLGFFGRFWWAFDVIAGYRLQLAVVLLAVAAGFRIGFGKATSILFLAAAATNVVLVLPLFFGSAAAAAADGGTLVITSVPVEETGRTQAMDWVEESGADIAFLLDTDDTWSGASPETGSGYITVDQVFYGRQTGITVVAREGLAVTVERRGTVRNPVVRVETSLAGSPIVLYAMDLSSPGSDSQADLRNEVISDVAAEITGESVPVAVIGGFAASPWSHAFSMFAGDADLTDSSRGRGFQGSSPGGVWIGFRVPTHHLLHTQTLTTVERHLGPDLGGSQRVLTATIAPSAG